jgi:hypothetical protein
MNDRRITLSLCTTITALLLLASGALRAQAPAPAQTPIPLRPLFEQIVSSGPMHAVMHSLTSYGDGQLQTAEQVSSRLKDAARQQPSEPLEQAAYAFAAGYQEALRQTFDKMLGSFVSTDPALPILVGEHREQVAVVLAGLVYTDVFNTLRTTTHERALLVARARALPALGRSGPLCQLPGVGFVGVEVVYGSMNFLDRLTSRSGEAVTVVTPVAACKGLIAGRLAEEELLRASDIYLHDRESHETRKVTLGSLVR